MWFLTQLYIHNWDIAALQLVHGQLLCVPSTTDKLWSCIHICHTWGSYFHEFFLCVVESQLYSHNDDTDHFVSNINIFMALFMTDFMVQVPAMVTLSSGHKLTGLHCLCLVLRRMAVGASNMTIGMEFQVHGDLVGAYIRTFLVEVFTSYKAVRSMKHPAWINGVNLEIIAQAVHAAGYPIPGPVASADGKCLGMYLWQCKYLMMVCIQCLLPGICKPCRRQGEAFCGHHR